MLNMFTVFLIIPTYFGDKGKLKIPPYPGGIADVSL
jgi:hypothetical protein